MIATTIPNSNSHSIPAVCVTAGERDKVIQAHFALICSKPGDGEEKRSFWNGKWCQALEWGAQGGGGVTILGGVQETGHGTMV